MEGQLLPEICKWLQTRFDVNEKACVALKLPLCGESQARRRHHNGGGKKWRVGGALSC